jgi:hypothetical protein
MRLPTLLSLLGLLAACSGDSSTVMSIFDDASAGGGTGHGSGGSGGAATSGQGGSGGGGVTIPVGSGGSGGSVSGLVSVRGGTRDVATAQCTTTSNGGGCPADPAFLQCLKGPCGGKLADCYQSGSAGLCADYAACMLTCPCEKGRSTCESDCLQNKAATSETCGPCLVNFLACWSTNGCAPAACSSTSGANTGTAGQ